MECRVSPILIHSPRSVRPRCVCLCRASAANESSLPTHVPSASGSRERRSGCQTTSSSACDRSSSQGGGRRTRPARRTNNEIGTKSRRKLQRTVATSAGCMTNWQGGAEPCRTLIGHTIPLQDTPNTRTHNTRRAQIRKCAPNVEFFEERLGTWAYLARR